MSYIVNKYVIPQSVPLQFHYALSRVLDIYEELEKHSALNFESQQLILELDKYESVLFCMDLIHEELEPLALVYLDKHEISNNLYQEFNSKAKDQFDDGSLPKKPVSRASELIMAKMEFDKFSFYKYKSEADSLIRLYQNKLTVPELELFWEVYNKKQEELDKFIFVYGLGGYLNGNYDLQNFIKTYGNIVESILKEDFEDEYHEAFCYTILNKNKDLIIKQADSILIMALKEKLNN